MKCPAMQLIVAPGGTIRCVYGELLDLSGLGQLSICRASFVEPDEQGRWWADLAPIFGPKLGPFERRSAALAAELRWLHQHILSSGSHNSV
jgi:hypothetical protein